MSHPTSPLLESLFKIGIMPARAAEYASRSTPAPPVILTAGRRGLADHFYVIDGGHRVTAARQRGMETLLALVRLPRKRHLPAPLGAPVEMVENEVAQEGESLRERGG